MKRTDAEQIVKDRLDDADIGKWFCPLILAACDTRCVCYEKLYVRVINENTDREYACIRGDYCSCHVLTGGYR